MITILCCWHERCGAHRGKPLPLPTCLLLHNTNHQINRTCATSASSYRNNEERRLSTPLDMSTPVLALRMYTAVQQQYYYVVLPARSVTTRCTRPERHTNTQHGIYIPTRPGKYEDCYVWWCWGFARAYIRIISYIYAIWHDIPPGLQVYTILNCVTSALKPFIVHIYCTAVRVLLLLLYSTTIILYCTSVVEMQ